MSQDELDLFKKELKGVRRIKNDQVNLHMTQKEPSLSQMARQEAALGRKPSHDPNYLTTDFVEPVEPNAWLEYKMDGVQEGVYKNLRLGKYEIDAHTDLHRLTVKEARDEVFYFIKACVKRGKRTVLITHGKGERSQPQAVLKSHVNHWLKQHELVMAFHSAQRKHGGLGSVYVLLKKNEHHKQLNREIYNKTT
ncbi:DNA endonuclease SmrA [Kangiella shandongensis]|uniref:DNA endonuclease SmrA n=1 Tax=Kangiella shandongensis TaxID=2763258 RepID=UPI001CBFFD6F|nr:DNA endonuclease SmrA [Kangiella shandongensis]